MKDLRKHYLDLNAARNAEFTSAKATLARRQYRAQHPTHIIALKCMDGRLLLPHITGTPIGIIEPFRNIGGQFDLGWPYFAYLIKDEIDYAISKARNVLILVTYHFSKSDAHKGCAGHGYDTKAAIAASHKLVAQFDNVFGGYPHGTIYPILVGIETDEDALTFHGVNESMLSVAKEEEVTRDEIKTKLMRLYPDMNDCMISDLLPLVVGNYKHIAEVRQTQRPVVDLDHREHILGVGRGFDWLHVPNKALIVGPYSYDLALPIGKAAGIVLSNIDNGGEPRIPKDEGILIMSSAGYRDVTGFEKGLAIEKAKSLAKLTLATIEERVPQLKKYLLEPLIGTVNSNTRLFESVE